MSYLIAMVILETNSLPE